MPEEQDVNLEVEGSDTSNEDSSSNDENEELQSELEKLKSQNETLKQQLKNKERKKKSKEAENQHIDSENLEEIIDSKLKQIVPEIEALKNTREIVKKRAQEWLKNQDWAIDYVDEGKNEVFYNGFIDAIKVIEEINPPITQDDYEKNYKKAHILIHADEIGSSDELFKKNTDSGDVKNAGTHGTSIKSNGTEDELIKAAKERGESKESIDTLKRFLDSRKSSTDGDNK